MQVPTVDASFEAPLLLGSQIFQFLREQIITGKLPEGTRLNELALHKSLKASRSPIREAFRRLEVEGLVEIIPRKGTFVRSISAEDLREATAVRACLEALALRLAAPCIDPGKLDELSRTLRRMDEAQEKRDVEEFTKLHWAFHKILIDAGGNQILARTYDMVTQPFISSRLTYRYLKRLDRFKGVSHRDIYELLVSGQVLNASRMMERHAMAFLDPSFQEKAPEPVEKKPTRVRR
jgi:DNA-binding GntR family transcriptional regulator